MRWSEVAPHPLFGVFSSMLCNLWRAGLLTHAVRLQSLCPSLGALERLSEQPMDQRSSSAPMSFAPVPQSVEEPVGLSPFQEEFPAIPAGAGVTLLCRVAERDIDTARDMLSTAPTAGCACPRGAYSVFLSRHVSP